MQVDLTEIEQFLGGPTPESWINLASSAEMLPLLLVDHAQCEKKAASTAMNLMFKYVDNYPLLKKMNKLAREELVHFDQVISLMQSRNIKYRHLPAGRYAGEMHREIRTYEPERLIDLLIIGAIVEARSCERFAKLIPHLDDEIGSFYQSLLKSESRHFKDYLNLAEAAAEQGIDERISYFTALELQLITMPDPDFRFHSGVPA